jgi:hypothetical protein
MPMSVGAIERWLATAASKSHRDFVVDLTPSGVELVAAMLTLPGLERGRPMEPEPPNLDAINDPESLAWILGSALRDLMEGRAHRLDRRDLPDWHPARRAGDLGDALVLTEDNELLGGL